MHSLSSEKRRVVIIGAGFGGMSAARALKNAPVDVEIVDRRNFHLFQPLLYQVATAELSPADIAWPIRGIFSKQENVSVCMSEVYDIDREKKVVRCEEADVPYDTLIVATGSKHSYFGNDHWAPHAPGLKKVVDATEARRRILYAFEQAEIAKDTREQDRCLTFVVVGAGPTGVEMAGAISDLANSLLAQDFRQIRARKARVILMEAGPKVLAAFPDRLSEKAKNSLESLGVEVSLNTMVTDINEDGVATADGFIPSATVIWAAGVRVEGITEWLKTDTDRAGRAIVNDHLQLPGDPDVFVIGDAAKVPWKDGLDVPGIAPAAKQQGKYVAKLLRAEMDGKPVKPFRYRHLGNLATIGRHAAVIDFGRVQLSGSIAWWIWGIAHIYFLIGVRQPLIVATNWLWSYLTHTKGARLITGISGSKERRRVATEAQPAPIAEPRPTAVGEN